MPRIIVTLVLLLASSCPVLSQTQPNTPPKPPSDKTPPAGAFTPDEFDRTLTKYRLQNCEADLKKWNDWHTSNKDALDEYEKNSRSCIEVVQSKKTEERIQTTIGYFSFAAGIVVSLFLIWRIAAAGKRFFQRRPFTPERKQLVTLLIASLWASAAAAICINNDALIKHPVNLLATVFVLSLPALLFGAVSFWWFGKAKREQAT